MRIFIEETDEFDIRDKERLQGFVKAYIDKVQISGGKKTIFSKNVFESKQEKWLADVHDRDKEVLRWVRPPTGQMPIPYKEGNYNPDFVAEARGNTYFLIEVKVREKMKEAQKNPNSNDVALKYKAGVAWCEAMSKATGKNWQYKLVPTML